MAQHDNADRPTAGVKENAGDATHVPAGIVADGGRQEALLKEYGEVVGNFRMLTDIRFKLLAFLPIAAAAAATISQESPGAIELALSLFGLVVTIGLVTYNARNDQLYDELVGRAAAIERDLGVPEGTFANRPRAWLRIGLLGRQWKVDHRSAVGIIYGASIALWIFGVVSYALGAAVQDLSTRSADVIAVAIAIVLTYLGSRSIRRQKQTREKDMRLLAASAMTIAVDRPIFEAARDSRFVGLCARLSESSEDKVRARATFYANADPALVSYYIPQDSRKIAASHLVALLTDLPPRWILDCYTNRRGTLPEAQRDDRAARP